MKGKIYAFLVNRHIGIQTRYHSVHDNSTGIKKIWSWIYLLMLNFGYYVLFMRFLGKAKDVAIYEEKSLPIIQSETEQFVKNHMTVDEYIKKVSEYDVVSFDIFDTLIFRPLTEPTDLFYFVGNDLGFMDFKNVRMQAEYEARMQCYKKNKHMEIGIKDIWDELEKMTGIPAIKGIELEMQYEMRFCYANPFMQKVYKGLQKLGKKIIITSDMYLPAEFLEKMLKKNGYTGFSHIFISNEYKASKAEGDLYDVVKADAAKNGRMIHIGDNQHSDIAMAKKRKVDALHYQNVNQYSLMYRPYDMSAIIGSAYRGIVNNYLYNGLNVYSKPYEFGFIYGGLFVLGYCNFIHRYCETNGINKVLFLSRDGDILMQAYKMLYPNESFEYVYWSRRAATQLMAENNRYDYFRRFLYHKVNQKKTVFEVLKAMDLEGLCEKLPEAIAMTDELTDKNVKKLKRFIEDNWSDVRTVYETKHMAAKKYYQAVLADCQKVCAVDIGWAGSGAISLDYLVQNVWDIPCQVIGMIAGTNTIYNAEPNASETFLQTGKLVAYLYSQSHNRDLLKKHDPNKGYNIFWEILLSSPTPQFRGFKRNEATDEVEFEFGDYDKNVEGIKEIQRGILNFVAEYKEHFGEIPFMYEIGGRDAYAPMLLAASKDERYVKAITKEFEIEIGVN